MTPECRLNSIARPIAQFSAGHQFLDITASTTCRRAQPVGLILGRRHAGQLPRDGPTDGAVAQSLGELGKMLQRFGHTNPFLGPAWSISEEALDILGQARVAEANVDGAARCANEPDALFPIEMRASLGETRELVVDVLPIGAVAHDPQ